MFKNRLEIATNSVLTRQSPIDSLSKAGKETTGRIIFAQKLNVRIRYRDPNYLLILDPRRAHLASLLIRNTMN